jgi:hypothetical protein
MAEHSTFVVCVNNAEYPASLELRKIYEVVSPGAEAEGLLRIVDESGEDYLYPRELFVPIELPQEVREALRKAS